MPNKTRRKIFEDDVSTTPVDTSAIIIPRKIKAWAVVDRKGKLVKASFGQYEVHSTKLLVEKLLFGGESVKRCTIIITEE